MICEQNRLDRLILQYHRGSDTTAIALPDSGIDSVRVVKFSLFLFFCFFLIQPKCIFYSTNNTVRTECRTGNRIHIYCLICKNCPYHALRSFKIRFRVRLADNIEHRNRTVFYFYRYCHCAGISLCTSRICTICNVKISFSNRKSIFRLTHQCVFYSINDSPRTICCTRNCIYIRALLF